MSDLVTLDGHRFATLPWPVAELSVRVDALADRLGFRVNAWEEDGLGPARGAVLCMPSGRAVLLMELAHALDALGAEGPSVQVDATDVAAFGIDALVAEVLAALELPRNALAWVPPAESRAKAAEVVAFAATRAGQASGEQSARS